MKKILVCEDEQSIRDFIVINLKRSGYDVTEADTGEKTLELYEASKDFSIAVLDVMLPGIDGYEVCTQIRANDPNIGIIFLTAKAQEVDKITGLMTGADDYMQKPFSPSELIARVDALYRRVSLKDKVAESEGTASGPFVINLKSRTITKSGVKLVLTQVEYLLMKCFIESPNVALSRETLLQKVWGDTFLELKVVDVNVRRLRMKIESDASNPDFIKTIWGYGYKWEVN
ncbi:MAG: response regulator transcription factor [Clostridia bacterium]